MGEILCLSFLFIGEEVVSDVLGKLSWKLDVVYGFDSTRIKQTKQEIVNITGV